jgi:hypothetical protein
VVSLRFSKILMATFFTSTRYRKITLDRTV